MCFVEQKTFSLILRIFLTNATPCGSLCILVYKNADVDNFYSKSLRSMDNFFFADLKVIIMCFVGQKTFSVILCIFLTNAPPLWFPLYFDIQKC